MTSVAYLARRVMVWVVSPACGEPTLSVSVELAAPTTTHSKASVPPLPGIAFTYCILRPLLSCWPLMSFLAATSVSGVTCALTLAPLAAAIAERLPRRAFLVGLDLIRAVVVLALPFVDQVWQIYVLIFLLQAASAGADKGYGLIGAGLAAIGVGSIFGQYLNGAVRNPEADAIVALGGKPGATGGIPSGDSALYAHAARYGVESGIRTTLAKAVLPQ